tara:strand:+ start:697 stop:963 length:267 start_codon:yes stop_codon:yes gene_type:complete
MTSINVTEVTNTVVATENGTTTTIETPVTTVVTASTIGPQGPQGAAGNFTLSDDNKVDKSIIYYDSTASTYKADSTWTTSTITDGGNF